MVEDEEEDQDLNLGDITVHRVKKIQHSKKTKKNIY
jgi:hypothetical protein